LVRTKWEICEYDTQKQRSEYLCSRSN
jgi:hypothetical protein